MRVTSEAATRLIEEPYVFAEQGTALTTQDHADAHAVLNQVSQRTQTVHAGENRDGGTWPIVTPIYQSTAFAAGETGASSMRQEAGLPSYSRDRFPNERELEEAVAALEGADAGCAASSGMAAISLVFLTFLSSGDHVLLAAGCYCDTGELLAQVFDKFGVDVTAVDATDADAVERAITPRTRLMMVETIGNPSMGVPDLDRLSPIAARHGVLFCVDNTFATPMLCQPLVHGADLVIHSATKFLGGHHDLTAGVVVGSSELIERVWKTAYLIGALPGPMDTWLALRGIRTLAPRMAWINETADVIVRELQGHPHVREVHYPGLATGAEAEVVHRMLPKGAGGMFTMQIAGGDSAAEAFVSSLRLIPYVPSLGGTTTSVCFPPRSLAARQDGQGADGWLRFSIGLESVDDLLGDIAQALDNFGTH